MASEPCRLIVVDDHELYRRGLVAALRETEWITVVSEAASGAEAVEAVLRQRPDMVIMDLEMPGVDGVEATRRILEQRSDVQILIVSAVDDHDKVVEALAAGVAGYVLKDADPADVVEAIATVRRGESVLSPRVTRALVDRVRASAQTAPVAIALPLSDRERDVLRLMSEGAGNRDISQTLFISENTVKRHVSSVLDKLGAANRVQAVVAAIRGGLVDG